MKCWCKSRVLYARWRFSTYLWIPMCMCAHLAHVAVEISDHSPNFLDTPRMSSELGQYCDVKRDLETDRTTGLGMFADLLSISQTALKLFPFFL